MNNFRPQRSQICMTMIALVLLLSAVTIPVTARTPIRVACVGNSITYGYGIPEREHLSYPSRLAGYLGEGYDVRNFGHSGATLLRHGHNPYTALPEYKEALDFRPDIVVIHLGINDTDPRDWPNHNSEFVTDYLQLISSFRNANPGARILIARLTPIAASHHRFRSGTRQWRAEVNKAIERVAQVAGAELIDFETPLLNRPDTYIDAVHPGASGAMLLARTAARAITGDYGGLKLNPLYTAGMVLQHGTPLRISGEANPSDKIVVTLDSLTYRTHTAHNGTWAVIAAPLAPGGPYTMKVTSPDSVITLPDILAGEVWLASGQSNMEFPLIDARGGVKGAVPRADAQLRFFHMRPRALTKAEAWPDSVCQAIDSLDYYLPARWETASPETAAYFSAVAAHFGAVLRDSLQMPIGIILNAVGGSNTESWTDITTLQQHMPEILVNWRTNDYLQPWCQQRAVENAGKAHRHPYEPSYLFATGIQPLGAYPLRGVIWYQGESNAHNTTIHESLFPLLVSSWRKHFKQPELPFLFVQLSSIDRPSWPEFRDSQRRMASSIPNVAMAVSSDLGDSLNVHPIDKRRIGQRLARLALKRLYGHSNLIASGPEPMSAVRVGNAVKLTLANSDTIITTDGTLPRTFELAETDGLFRPATATITSSNTIFLSAMDIKHPRFVRYAWQPFTRANVANGDSLPMSTFKLDVTPTDDLQPEKGLEYGVSASFAGIIDGRAVTAGGCNFPTADPFASEARKVSYQGIYAFNRPTGEWTRIGSLPEPTAYGMSAQWRDGLVAIGGITPGGASRAVYAIIPGADSMATVTPLPSLPSTIDNAAAAAIGDKIFVAGGNVDGVPSRALFMIDLSSGTPHWQRLRDMPGNPRVQPVMAASNGQLYLWGGFAPRHEGHEPTLELSGLAFDPAKGNWRTLPALVDVNGSPVSVGGGCAATLPDGSIAVAGGVNKDIFLDALRNQAPDYLTHPVAWYRFNPSVIIFNPSTGTSSALPADSMTARAGATLIACPDGSLILTGGELKPRIRTAETLSISF